MPLLVARPPQEGLCLWPPGRLWGDPLTPRDQGVCQDWGGVLLLTAQLPVQPLAVPEAAQ